MMQIKKAKLPMKNNKNAKARLRGARPVCLNGKIIGYTEKTFRELWAVAKQVRQSFQEERDVLQGLQLFKKAYAPMVGKGSTHSSGRFFPGPNYGFTLPAIHFSNGRLKRTGMPAPLKSWIENEHDCMRSGIRLCLPSPISGISKTQRGIRPMATRTLIKGQ